MDLGPHIKSRRGALEIGGIDAGTLANQYGTPLYVTDLERIAGRYKIAFEALRSRHVDCLVAFAYKSNPMPDVVRTLSRCGAGGTIVSGEGLGLAAASGVNPKNLVFDGPSKSKEDLAAAIRAGVGMINAESIQEVLDIESLCSRLQMRARVGFRANFDIHVETHAGLATGSKGQKFGIDRKDVVRFCKERAGRLAWVNLAGLHSHIGSQITDMGTFRRLSEELVSLGDELERHGVDIHEFNFGGGLGVDYGHHQGADSFEDYADATAGAFSELRGAHGGRLVFELGRSIVADSTILLTRVNYLKRGGTVNWALVDAGMNDFLRPALYGASHPIVPALVKDGTPSKIAYSVGGPVCESTDVFGANQRLGVKLSQGDILAILDAGAYGISMASTYNMRPLPKVAVVSKGRHRLGEGWTPEPQDAYKPTQQEK